MSASMPVPVWNNLIGQWEAVDFQHGQRVVNWPAGFDATLLPAPAYSDGDRVQFVRDETCAREGVVRQVLFQGRLEALLESGPETARNVPLDADNIVYIVTARGHDHRIKAWNILSRFVSLEPISRALPRQE